jgi:hypothetical protein
VSGKTFTKTIAVGRAGLTVVLGSAALLSQQTPAAPSSSAGLELPVIMLQNVAAGNPVGTKVQAKLALATLVHGVVVPQEALLSGEVTESVAKSATNPSRLAIRMDSAQWKNGSAPIRVYLTAWYYPMAMLTGQDDLSSALSAAQSRQNSRSQPYPISTRPSFPDPDKGRPMDPGPAPPASDTSRHRVLMKNVESTRNSEGAVILSSKRFNIKLDKQTTYVLAAGDLLPAK